MRFRPLSGFIFFNLLGFLQVAIIVNVSVPYRGLSSSIKAFSFIPLISADFVSVPYRGLSSSIFKPKSCKLFGDRNVSVPYRGLSSSIGNAVAYDIYCQRFRPLSGFIFFNQKTLRNAETETVFPSPIGVYLLQSITRKLLMSLYSRVSVPYRGLSSSIWIRCAKDLAVAMWRCFRPLSGFIFFNP